MNDKSQVKMVSDPHDWESLYNEEKEIVDRVWKALGITTYEQAKPHTIWEHVATLQSQLTQAHVEIDKLTRFSAELEATNKTLHSLMVSAERRGEEKANVSALERVRVALPDFSPSSGHDCIDELLGLIRVSQGQRDSAESQFTKVTEKLAELWANTETIINDRTKDLTTLLTQAHKERDEMSAACAVMREFIEHGAKLTCDCNFDNGHEETCRIVKAHDLLSTNYGKAFLERMKEAEWIIENAGDAAWTLNYKESCQWLKRRDAWLTPPTDTQKGECQ